MYVVQQLNSYWEDPVILLGPKSWQIVLHLTFLVFGRSCPPLVYLVISVSQCTRVI